MDKIRILLNLLHRSLDVWTCYPRPNNAYEPHLSVIGYNFSYYNHYSWNNNATQKMSAINTKVHEQRTHGKGFAAIVQYNSCCIYSCMDWLRFRLCRIEAVLKARTTDTQWSLFHWNPELWGLGRQTNWADKFLAEFFHKTL